MTSTPYQLSVRLKRADYALGLAFFVFVVAAGAWRIAPGVAGVVHDDGVYVSTARSLAEGSGYRLINLPGEPRQTKYPVLYPALLALVWRLAPSFPANLVVMQWLTLAMAAGAVALSYLFLVQFRYASRGVAASSALLCSLVPMFLYLSTLTMAEGPFALLVVIALWAAERHLTSPDNPSKARDAMLGVVIALPFLCRGFGLALPAAVAWSFARARRPTMFILCGSAVVVGSWMAWAWAGSAASGDELVGYYTDYADSAMATFGPHGPRILMLNAVAIVTCTVGMALDGLRRIGEPTAIAIVQGFFLVGVITWIVVARAAWRGVLVPTFLAAYFCIALAWPWRPPRFLIPVLPLLVASAFTVVAQGLARLPSRLVRAGRLLCVAVVVTAALTHCASLAEVSALVRKTGYPDEGLGRANGGAYRAPATWAAYQELFEWIRNNTAPDDVLGCISDSMVFLYTGRKGYRPTVYRPEAFYGAGAPVVGTPEELMSRLARGGARYLVLLPGYADRAALDDVIASIQQQHPTFFETVYVGGDSRFSVLRVNGNSVPGIF